MLNLILPSGVQHFGAETELYDNNEGFFARVLHLPGLFCRLKSDQERVFLSCEKKCGEAVNLRLVSPFE